MPIRLERKWLISTSTTGACCRIQTNRAGSVGVAPDARSMIPAAAVSTASEFGAPARIAGRNSRHQPMRPLNSRAPT